MARPQARGRSRRARLSFARRALLTQALTPSRALDQAGQAPTTTSGWNSSATACWRLPSPSCCASASRTSAKASWRAATTPGARRDLRRGRPARSISAPPCVLSDSEAQSGGRDKATILADACEALLGAIFLEAGFEPRAALRRARYGAPSSSGRRRRRRRQDRAAGVGAGPRPRRCRDYARSAARARDHAPRFTVEVAIKGTSRRAAKGGSKRAAEQAAATALLAREGVVERAPMMTGTSQRRAAASSPSSARPTPASRRWSTRWSAPRSPSSATRCRPRACRCAASRIAGRAARSCFVDTPGIFAPRRRLDRAMVDAAWGGARTPTSSVLMVDAERGVDEETRAILERLKETASRRAPGAEQGRPRASRSALLALAAELQRAAAFERHLHGLAR